MGVDRVAIKPDEKKTTSGGIVIPHSQVEDSMSGTIVSVGTGSSRPLVANVGERWLYDPAQAIKVDGFVILRESALLAKIKNQV